MDQVKLPVPLVRQSQSPGVRMEAETSHINRQVPYNGKMDKTNTEKMCFYRVITGVNHSYTQQGRFSKISRLKKDCKSPSWVADMAHVEKHILDHALHSVKKATCSQKESPTGYDPLCKTISLYVHQVHM